VSDRGGHIGIFDSGIGGLSVLRALRAELPQQHLLYIADSAHAPYGERDEAFVLKRSRVITAYLQDRGMQALVIACNTATAAAVDQLRADHPQLPIIGVEPALKPAAALSTTGRIGVMATRGTLASARFRHLLGSLSAQAEFVLQPCDGLAEAIEQTAGDAEIATELIAECARHTSAMGRFGLKPGDIDTLVLGCTHYPFAAGALRQIVGPDVQLIATGEAVARQVRRQLGGLAARSAEATPGRIELLTTGKPLLLEAAAKRWIGPDSSVGLLSLA
jgi:glutamate racemase